MAAANAPDGRPPSGADGDWLYERKLDGVRTLAWVDGDAVSLLSRNRIHQEDVYPEACDGLAEAVAVPAVVDGEVVAYDADGTTSFSRLQQRMHTHNEARSRRNPVKVTFVAFDLLWVAGRDVRDLPLSDRKALLAQVVDPGPAVELAPALTGHPDDLVAAARAAGWEGLIAKRLSSRYQGRRSRDWVKLKVVRQQEMVVIGWTPPTGSGRVGLGALLLGYHDGGRLRYGGKVGTGFTEAVLKDLRARLEAIEVDLPPVAEPPRERGARWVAPTLVVQVGFGEWSEAGRLRHPRYLGLRVDSDPADVVRE